MSNTDQRTGVTSSFSYDTIYQLTGVSQGTTTTESYTYDSVGNRLSSLSMSPYQYNSSNELTATPTTTYTYDKNGNLTTRVDSTGTITYTWDTYSNRLTSVTLPGSGGTVTFKFDPFGRRIQKSSPSGTTNYLYDGENLLEEVDQSGNVLGRYTHGPWLDQPLATLRSGVSSYYQQDGLYSVTSLTDPTAAVVSTNTYDSFGNLTSSTGTVVNPYRFAGRELDSETGSYFNRARYYNPAIGRFLSEDPIRFSGGIDFYAYVVNRPTVLADPFGLAPNQAPNPSLWQQFWNWLHGPPKPKPPNPIRPPNLCETGQTRLFSEAGPNPYNRDGHGEERWAQFQDAFIDKCLAAKTPGNETVPYCTQGAGVLGPFAYCDCCQYCSKGGK